MYAYSMESKSSPCFHGIQINVMFSWNPEQFRVFHGLHKHPIFIDIPCFYGIKSACTYSMYKPLLRTSVDVLNSGL